jgi:putative tryptophan/tyrosine transport system substrate-binding protein
MTSPIFGVDRERLPRLALDLGLPSMFPERSYVEPGGLMSYGANGVGMARLAARYVDQILKDVKPADLPVEQPTRFELVVNLKTAKAIDVTVTPAILARADEIIE